MILIPDKPVFVRDPEGHLASFDLSKLNQDLREAFKQNGLQDTWLVDQFSMTMEEKLRNETARKTPLAESDIDTLMSSVLTASGYPDVAGSFNELRGASPIRKILATLAPWDDSRILNVLSKRLPLTHRQVEELVPKCQQTFRQLGMTHVSDNFIAELAIHLVHQHHAERPAETETPTVLPTPSRPAPVPSGAPHLHTPAELKEQADEVTRKLLDAQIISMYPVAPLFPRAQLSFSLQRFCQAYTGGWPSELAISVSLGPVARAIRNLLQTCREDIARVFPSFADSPSYVVLTHYADFVQKTYGEASKVDRLAFDHNIRQLLSQHLVNQASFDLKLHYT